MPLVTKAECDVFPKSIDPIKLYELKIVEADIDDRNTDSRVDVFWSRKYFGKRALARAVKALEFATSPPSPPSGNSKKKKSDDTQGRMTIGEA